MRDVTKCRGCRNDFYNGNNDLGVKRCWSFKSAKMVWKYAIGWWVPQDSAKNFRRVRVPSCYHKTGDTAYYDTLPSRLTQLERRAGAAPTEAAT